jgi:hypothetical protein
VAHFLSDCRVQRSAARAQLKPVHGMRVAGRVELRMVSMGSILR